MNRSSAVHTTPPQRRLGWLLWLVLLLPLAQVAAHAHLLSHVQALVAGQSGDEVVHPSSCELCVGAATLTNAALTGTLVVIAAVAWAGPEPSPVSADAWQGRFAAPYRSRAPPTAAR